MGARCSTDAALGVNVCHSHQVILKDGETGCICSLVVSTARSSSILLHSLSTTAHLPSRCCAVNCWLAFGRTSALCGHTASMLRRCDPSLRLSAPCCNHQPQLREVSVVEPAGPGIWGIMLLLTSWLPHLPGLCFALALLLSLFVPSLLWSPLTLHSKHSHLPSLFSFFPIQELRRGLCFP